MLIHQEIHITYKFLMITDIHADINTGRETRIQNRTLNTEFNISHSNRHTCTALWGELLNTHTPKCTIPLHATLAKKFSNVA